MTAPLARNRGIDVVRGLSIGLVVIHHMALRFSLRKSALGDWVPKRILNALSYNGYEAVFVFFVVSGFLIASHTLRRSATLGAIDLRAFYARRFARIAPCLVLVVAVLAALDLAHVQGFTIEHANQTLGGAAGSAFALCLNWYEGKTGYLPGGWDVLWSLSIEETFYLAFPILCVVFRKPAWLAVPLVVLALSLPATRAALEGNEVWQEKAYLPGMAAIATGVLAAFVTHRRRAVSRSVARILVAIGALAVGAVLVVEDVLWKALGNGTMLVLTFGAATMIAGLHWREADALRGGSLRGTGWLQSAGRLSYEIYLSHMFVVLAIVPLAARVATSPRIAFVWYLPALLASWLLGNVIARVYSVPCDRALRVRLVGKA